MFQSAVDPSRSKRAIDRESQGGFAGCGVAQGFQADRQFSRQHVICSTRVASAQRRHFLWIDSRKFCQVNNQFPWACLSVRPSLGARSVERNDFICEFIVNCDGDSLGVACECQANKFGILSARCILKQCLTVGEARRWRESLQGSKRETSPNGLPLVLVLDLADKFVHTSVATTSVFNGKPNHCRDDSTVLQNYVDAIQDAEDACRLDLRLPIEGVHHPEFLISDVVPELRGACVFHEVERVGALTSNHGDRLKLSDSTDGIAPGDVQARASTYREE